MPKSSAPPFPEPEIITGRNYWPKGAVRRWRAANAGLPDPAPETDDDVLINARQVCAMFGNVSLMWLYRKRQPKAEAVA